MRLLARVALTALLLSGLIQAQDSFWSSSTLPGPPQLSNDTSSVTLGLKFYSDVPGSVTPVRFPH
jgi:hypothetical protein